MDITDLKKVKTIIKINSKKDKKIEKKDEYDKREDELKKSLEELGNPNFCEHLSYHMLVLDITGKRDLKELFSNSEKGMCDFFNKCKSHREECGCNLVRSKLMSTPDHCKFQGSTSPKDDSEEKPKRKVKKKVSPSEKCTPAL